MADYDVQRTLWTNPCAAEGMWKAAPRCWELSAVLSSTIDERMTVYTGRISDLQSSIYQIQQQIDQLPIDSPDRASLEQEKQRLQTELSAQQDRKNNLSGLSDIDYMFKGRVDKRDVLALLENSIVRRVMMRNNTKYIRRDPNYGVVSGRIPVLSSADYSITTWCAEQQSDGTWMAKQKPVYPLIETTVSATSQIPLLSSSLVRFPLLQACDATPYLNTDDLYVPVVGENIFCARNALCALTLPADMNNDAMPVQMISAETSAGGYAVGLSAANYGFSWTVNYPSMWMDNNAAFNGSISAIHNINNFDFLERAGWGGVNNQWISGLTSLNDTDSRLTVKTGVDMPRIFAEWYSPRARYIGINYAPVQPVAPITQFYYDRNFISAWGVDIIKRLGEYDFTTGQEISSFWGMFQPETPSVWPRALDHGLPHKAPDAMDIYTGYWNLSKMDTLGVWLPYSQTEVKCQITGVAYDIYNGSRIQERIELSDSWSGSPDYLWMDAATQTNWQNFKVAFYDPYTSFTRRSSGNDNEQEIEDGCTFRGRFVGNWAELSADYEHCTVWYYNDIFDRYCDVLGVWYIVPVLGYSAKWKQWYDSVLLQNMVNFDQLDVKVNILAVRADTMQDQTTKSWRAYMGNAFWMRMNQIYWEDCMPSAPSAPEYPHDDDANHSNVENCSLHCCKCLGPTLAVVKYRWRDGSSDDGVHYIPTNLPKPKYTWQKRWENAT